MAFHNTTARLLLLPRPGRGCWPSALGRTPPQVSKSPHIAFRSSSSGDRRPSIIVPVRPLFTGSNDPRLPGLPAALRADGRDGAWIIHPVRPGPGFAWPSWSTTSATTRDEVHWWKTRPGRRRWRWSSQAAVVWLPVRQHQLPSAGGSATRNLLGPIDLVVVLLGVGGRVLLQEGASPAKYEQAGPAHQRRASDRARGRGQAGLELVGGRRPSSTAGGPNPPAAAPEWRGGPLRPGPGSGLARGPVPGDGPASTTAPGRVLVLAGRRAGPGSLLEFIHFLRVQEALRMAGGSHPEAWSYPRAGGQGAGAASPSGGPRGWTSADGPRRARTIRARCRLSGKAPLQAAGTGRCRYRVAAPPAPDWRAGGVRPDAAVRSVTEPPGAAVSRRRAIRLPGPSPRGVSQREPVLPYLDVGEPRSWPGGRSWPRDRSGGNARPARRPGPYLVLVGAGTDIMSHPPGRSRAAHSRTAAGVVLDVLEHPRTRHTRSKLLRPQRIHADVADFPRARAALTRRWGPQPTTTDRARGPRTDSAGPSRTPRAPWPQPTSSTVRGRRRAASGSRRVVAQPGVRG